ncbi:MAG: hypothetical protein JWM57_2233 [Phycisphaerales bacterium]|nr:hypothetical protein [Phycisphaerales bacterium]
MAETIRVEAQRVPFTSNPAEDLAADLRRAEVFAKLMDSQFDVGGVKVGLDALVGLIPVAGDAVSALIGLYPLYLARKHGLGKIVMGRMLMNLGVDFLAGSVPVAGDLLDVFVKANLKNVELLKKAAARDGRIG